MLIRTTNDDFCRRLYHDCHIIRYRHIDRMREAKFHVKSLASEARQDAAGVRLHGGAVTHANEVYGGGIALGYADDGVVYEGTREPPYGALFFDVGVLNGDFEGERLFKVEVEKRMKGDGCTAERPLY